MKKVLHIGSVSLGLLFWFVLSLQAQTPPELRHYADRFELRVGEMVTATVVVTNTGSTTLTAKVGYQYNGTLLEWQSERGTGPNWVPDLTTTIATTVTLAPGSSITETLVFTGLAPGQTVNTARVKGNPTAVGVYLRINPALPPPLHLPLVLAQ